MSLLSLKAVTCRFGGITALNGLTLDLPAGAITGVIGPNGAGKTTLFNCITGAYRPSAGEIRLRGQDLVGLPPHRIARLGIGRTFQNIRLFPSMTVWEHLMVVQRGGGWRAALAPLGLSGAAPRRRAEQALERFGLAPFRDRLATTLPYGVMRRVELARALTTEPALLLLDEPVAGMNHAEAAGIANLLQGLVAEGLTLLLIEHDMSFVEQLCQRVHVLDFGTLIASGTPAEVRRIPAVIDAYLGVEA
jgi:branched-chain amino acid transport system ATP-binding protein